MPSSLSRSGRRLVLLAAAALSLTVATSTDTTNHFTWLDCPLPALAPSPSPPPPLPSTINSTFPSNVLALLHALPSAAAPTGFASLSRGEGTSRGFVRGLCRGDSAPDVCSRCLQSATLHIDGHCSSNRHRRAGIWYDKCFLSYADTDTSTTYEEGFRQALYNHRNISDKDVFDRNNTYLNLVIKISDLAANGGSSELASAVPMFATGEAVYDDRGAPNGTKYGMVQCMRDRTASECALCLWNSMEQLETRNGGGEMLGYNCYLRVEFYAFYNLSLSAVPASPPLAPAPSSFMSTVGERNSKLPTLSQFLIVLQVPSSLLLISTIYLHF